MKVTQNVIAQNVIMFWLVYICSKYKELHVGKGQHLSFFKTGGRHEFFQKATLIFPGEKG